MNAKRLLMAAFAAGAWVMISGMLMAGLFGYREMKSAFDALGLQIPSGADTMLLHTAVRLSIGSAVALLYAVFMRTMSAGRALFGSAAITWVLAILLPSAVIADWGVLSWPVTAKVVTWGAGELLIAAAIARLIYRPR